MLALLKIDFILTKRNGMAMLISIGLPILFFLLFSSIYMSQIPDDTIRQQVVRNYLFSMTAFSMSGFGFFTLPLILDEDRRHNWLKLIRQSPLTLGQYYLAKFVRVLVLFILSIITTLGVGVYVKHVSLPISDWLVIVAILLGSGLFFIACGIAISLLPSQQLISVVGNLLYFALAIFGGSWVPVSLFPDWMKTISKLLPTYHINIMMSQYVDLHRIELYSILNVVGYTLALLLLTIAIKKHLEVK